MEKKVLAEHDVCNNRGESQHLQICHCTMRWIHDVIISHVYTSRGFQLIHYNYKNITNKILIFLCT